MSNSIGFIKTDTFPTSRQAGEQESVACVLCQCMVGSFFVCVCLSISIFSTFNLDFPFILHFVPIYSFASFDLMPQQFYRIYRSFQGLSFTNHSINVFVFFFLSLSFILCSFSLALCLSFIKRFLLDPFKFEFFKAKIIHLNSSVD